MSNLKFSKEHEWIKIDGDIATIGITKHATEMLGDIVFIELPKKETLVVKVLSIMDRMAGGSEELKRRGYDFESLFVADDKGEIRITQIGAQ